MGKMVVYTNNNRSEIETLMEQEFTNKKITEIDMRILGKIVYGKAVTLSEKVNSDLLEPISHWLDDPDWMSRFKIDESNKPDWAKYKRKQRQWEKQQKQIASERLKLYWQEIKKRRKLRNEMKRIVAKSSSGVKSQVEITRDFIDPIISPFSPLEQHKEETRRQFLQVFSLSVSDLMPWQIMISAELTETKKFESIKKYHSDLRMDTASKIIHLLQMETEGKIILIQEQPFSDITIEPIEISDETEITIKDRQGRDYNFDWQTLSENQRNKIVSDIKDHKIICKTT